MEYTSSVKPLAESGGLCQLPLPKAEDEVCAGNASSEDAFDSCVPVLGFESDSKNGHADMLDNYEAVSWPEHDDCEALGGPATENC